MATFGELKELLFWACDDGTNADDLLALKDGYDGNLINEAIMDLADCLNIVRYTTGLLPDSDGKVVLPVDFMEVRRIKWGDTDLKQIDSLFDSALGSGSVTQYMFVGLRIVQLYDTPTPPYSTLHLWYRAYPPKLAADDDVPDCIPDEFHNHLATVYGKAQFHKKIGDLAVYQQLFAMWQAVKKSLREAVFGRAYQSDAPRSWRW